MTLRLPAAARAVMRSYASTNYDVVALLLELADSGDRTLLSSAQIRDLWAKEGSLDEPGLRSFYVSVPYCTERCTFCQYYKYPLKDRGDTDGHATWLEAAFAYFAPAFEGVSFRQLVVGGGTPSVLAADQIERIFGNLFEHYTIDDAGMPRTFEFTPRTVTAKRLAALRRVGFDRISMGVQTIDKAILDDHHRFHQSVEVLRRSVGLIREHGFETLNLDLILGMTGDSPEGFRASFEEVASLGPEKITAYHLVPQPDYLEACYDSKPTRFQEQHARLVDHVLTWLPELADSLGYDIDGGVYRPETTGWIFRRRGSTPAPVHDQQNIYDDSSPTPFSLFGLGPDARSQIRNRVWYRDTGPRPMDFDPHEQRYSVGRIDRDYEKLKFLLMTLERHHQVRKDDFVDLFSETLDEAYGPQLDQLRSAGLITETEEILGFPGDRIGRFTCALTLAGRAAWKTVLHNQRIKQSYVWVRFADRAWDLRVEALDADRAYLGQANGLGLRWLNIDTFTAEDQALERTQLFLKIARTAFKRAVSGDSRDAGGTSTRFVAALGDLSTRHRLGMRVEEKMPA